MAAPPISPPLFPMPSPIVRRVTRVLAMVAISSLTLVVAIVAVLQIPAVATLPEVRFREEGGVAMPFAERYSPIGGLGRVQGSAEVQLPLPGFDAKWQTFVFLDGARVWTSDDRFSLDAGELDQYRFFLGTGAGIGYETVVGAVQVALGYKLNPSALDQRDPDEVLQALQEGRPISTVPTDSRRRLQLHFSIGATFSEFATRPLPSRGGPGAWPLATCQTQGQVATLHLIAATRFTAPPSVAQPRSPSPPSVCGRPIIPSLRSGVESAVRAYPLHSSARFPRSYRVHRP